MKKAIKTKNNEEGNKNIRTMDESIYDNSTTSSLNEEVSNVEIIGSTQMRKCI